MCVCGGGGGGGGSVTSFTLIVGQIHELLLYDVIDTNNMVLYQ